MHEWCIIVEYSITSEWTKVWVLWRKINVIVVTLCDVLYTRWATVLEIRRQSSMMRIMMRTKIYRLPLESPLYRRILDNLPLYQVQQVSLFQKDRINSFLNWVPSLPCSHDSKMPYSNVRKNCNIRSILERISTMLIPFYGVRILPK